MRLVRLFRAAYRLEPVARFSIGSQSDIPSDACRLQRKILDASLNYVPQFGISRLALEKGVEEIGLPMTSHSLGGGPCDLLIHFHQRANHQAITELQAHLKTNTKDLSELTHDAVDNALLWILQRRLELNIPIMHPSLLTLSGDCGQHAGEIFDVFLHFIDDVCYELGDRSTDMRWYERRVALAALLSSGQLWMVVDRSANYADTWRLLRLQLAVLQPIATARHRLAASCEALSHTLYSAAKITKSSRHGSPQEQMEAADATTAPVSRRQLRARASLDGGDSLQAEWAAFSASLQLTKARRPDAATPPDAAGCASPPAPVRRPQRPASAAPQLATTYLTVFERRPVFQLFSMSDPAELAAQPPPVQAPPVQAPPVQAPPVQAPLVQAPAAQSSALELVHVVSEPLTRNSVSASEKPLANGGVHAATEQQPPDLPDQKEIPQFDPLEHLAANLYHVPLDEIDQSIKAPTFVVVGRRFRTRYAMYRFSAEKSLMFLSPFNPFRRWAVWLMTQQLFEIFVVFVTLANCFYLCWVDPGSLIPEYLFLCIFTAEMIIKTVAQGLVVGKYTYLRSTANVIDTMVVVTSYAALVMEILEYNDSVLHGLRACRVLRVLKIISIIPGLRTIALALIKSIRMLGDVLLLMIFCMAVFALFGLQIYMGTLRQKCVHYDAEEFPNWNAFLDEAQTNKELWKESEEEGYQLCGNASGALPCPAGYVCLPNIGDNPDGGFGNFDNFGWALMTAFQLMTLDYWETMYNKIIYTNGPWHMLFFIVTVFFGSFYVMNLLLAVIAKSYQEEAENAARKHALEGRQRSFSSVEVTAFHLYRPKRPIVEQLVTGIFRNQFYLHQLAQRNITQHYVNNGDGTGHQRRSSSGLNGINHQDLRHASTFASLDSSVNALTAAEAAEEGARCSWCASWTCSPHLPKCSRCRTCWASSDQLCGCSRDNPVCAAGRAMRRFIAWLTTDPFFEFAIIVCIILNTLALAAEYYGMEDSLTSTLDHANYVFTGIFTLESVLKIIAFGGQYFLNAWNLFDVFVVIASLVDIILTTVIRASSSGLSVIRTLRLLRIFKLAHSWKTMRVLLTIIFSTLSSLAYLTIVLVMLIYIIAIVGLQLFNHFYTPQNFGGLPVRWGFQDFLHSTLLVFRMLCAKWLMPLRDCVRVANSFCYPVVLCDVLFGNLLILNLFLALLLNAFQSESERVSEQDSVKSLRLQNRLTRLRAWSARLRARVRACLTHRRSPVEPSRAAAAAAAAANHSPPADRLNQSPIARRSSQSAANASTSDKIQTVATIEETNSRQRNVTRRSMQQGSSQASVEPVEDCCCECFFKLCCCRKLQPKLTSSEALIRFRTKLRTIVEHRVFEYLVMLAIFLSSLALCFEDTYIELRPDWQSFLKIFNYVIVTLFIIEMTLKIIAHGFKVYFTRFWTILDFIVILASVTAIIVDQVSPSNSSLIASFRALRALRPLRVISRWQGMRIVVNALVFAIPSIVDVLLVCLVIWLIFSIMGVQFFGGKFQQCVDDHGVRVDAALVPNQTACYSQNLSWINPLVNYDNVINGYLALLQVGTFEGWLEQMANAADLPTNIGDQPSFENGIGYYSFFIVFIIVGRFFMLNLFVGVIIDNFNALKKKFEGKYMDMFLTDTQKHFYKTIRSLGKRKPRKVARRHPNIVLAAMYDISTSVQFEMLSGIVIILNMIAMAVEHYQQSDEFTDILKALNVAFVTYFVLETGLKIVSFHYHYFYQPWNVFDFIVTWLSVAEVILEELSISSVVSPSLLRVIRVFRLTRLLRIIRSAEGVRKLLFALLISLPALFNIGSLLFLMMFIYSVVGMNMFDHIKYNKVINDVTNFKTFGSSMVLLFRLSTAAGWNEVLEGLSAEPPYCNDTHYFYNDTWTEGPNGDCGYPLIASIYLVSYIFITFFILINSYIAIILENFHEARAREDVGITEDDIDMFYLTWERYDPGATQFIRLEEAGHFLDKLYKPLRVPKPNELFLVSCDLPIYAGDRMHCLDILMALINRVVGNVIDENQFASLRQDMELKLNKEFPNRQKLEVITTTLERKKREIAARRIQQLWSKGFKKNWPKKQ